MKRGRYVPVKSKDQKRDGNLAAKETHTGGSGQAAHKHRKRIVRSGSGNKIRRQGATGVKGQWGPGRERWTKRTENGGFGARDKAKMHNFKESTPSVVIVKREKKLKKKES